MQMKVAIETEQDTKRGLFQKQNFCDLNCRREDICIGEEQPNKTAIQRIKAKCVKRSGNLLAKVECVFGLNKLIKSKRSKPFHSHHLQNLHFQTSFSNWNTNKEHF